MEIDSLENMVRVIFSIVETFATEPEDLSRHTIHYGFPPTPKEMDSVYCK